MKRQSLKLDDIDWQVLTGIARELRCEYRGTPSWRRLAGNAIDFHVQVLGLSFHDAMRQITGT